jgi:cation:H+ antiporter
MGAIIGAPFMLGTLAFSIVGITYLVSRASGKRTTPFDVSGRIIGNDLTFFIVAFAIGIGAGVLKHFWPEMPRWIDYALAALMIVVYLIYLRRMFNRDNDPATTLEDELNMLHIRRLFRRIQENRKRWISLQIFAALALMFFGAHEFVDYFSRMATTLGVNPLILALLIVPVATELPEKFNSVLWVSRGKDTLAVGNISGAMIFQSTFPVSLGLIFLDWRFSPRDPALVGAVFGLIGALLLMINMRVKGKASAIVMTPCGLLYVIYIILVVMQLSGVPVFDMSAFNAHGGGHGHGGH